MNKRAYILAIVLCVIFSGEVIGQDNDSTLDKQKHVLTTPEMAIERALEYTGFDGLGGFSKENISRVKKTVVHGEKMPFVASMINDREVWEVRFVNIAICRGDRQIVRDYTIYLNPESGKLLEVLSVSDDFGSSDTLPEPDAVAAENYLSQRGIAFKELPDEEPQVNLSQILTDCLPDPTSARVIKAIYVDHSSSIGHSPQSWILILRGVNPPPPHNRRMIENTELRERNSVVVAKNAKDGRGIYIMNAPLNRPELKRKVEE